MSILDFPDVIPADVEWQLDTRSQTFEDPISGSVQGLELIGAAKWMVSLTFPGKEEADGRIIMGFLAKCKGVVGRFYLHNHAFPFPAGAATGEPSGGEVLGASATATNTESVGATVIELSGSSRTFLTGEYVKFANHDDVYEVISGGSIITIEATGLTTEVPSATVVVVHHQGSVLKTDGWPNDTLIFKIGDFFGVGTELKIITEDITSSGSGGADLIFEPGLRASPANDDLIVVDEPKAVMRLKDNKQTKGSFKKNVQSSFIIDIIEAFAL